MSIKYIRIPAGLLKLGISSANELLILALAVSFGEKGLRMSNSKLGETLATDRRLIPRVIRRLEAKGYVLTSTQHGRRIIKADIKVMSLADIKVMHKRHQSDAQVTSLRPCPSITEGTEGTETPRARTSSLRKPFAPPTVSEVREYATSQGQPAFDAEKFVGHYAVLDWHDVGGHLVTDWQRKVKTWLQEDAERAAKLQEDSDREDAEIDAKLAYGDARLEGGQR